MASYALIVMGEAGAFILCLYLFVTLGNGFRYGRKYLYVSQAFSMLGFGAVLVLSPFWSQHIGIGIGFMFALFVVPMYCRCACWTDYRGTRTSEARE